MNYEITVASTSSVTASALASRVGGFSDAAWTDVVKTAASDIGLTNLTISSFEVTATARVATQSEASSAKELYPLALPATLVLLAGLQLD